MSEEQGMSEGMISARREIGRQTASLDPNVARQAMDKHKSELDKERAKIFGSGISGNSDPVKEPAKSEPAQLSSEQKPLKGLRSFIK